MIKNLPENIQLTRKDALKNHLPSIERLLLLDVVCYFLSVNNKIKEGYQAL